MYFIAYFTIIYIFRLISSSTSFMSKTPDDNKIRITGDIIFGGLFPMHEKGQYSESCGKIKKERGVQRLEAMLFAVDQINKDPSILPGVTIGVHILDTCSADTYALEQCMDFIKAQLTKIDLPECEDGMLRAYKPLKAVAGVIGAASSPVSIMVANILRLFKVRFVFKIDLILITPILMFIMNLLLFFNLIITRTGRVLILVTFIKVDTHNYMYIHLG